MINGWLAGCCRSFPLEPDMQGNSTEEIQRIVYLLVVSTHLKTISQIGSFPQVGVKIKNIWNHQPE